MKPYKRFISWVALITILLLPILTNIGCQYDYTSPLPGIIEIRLKTISDTTQIDFLPLNSFTLTISQQMALRSNKSEVQMYSDIKAFETKPIIVNTLNPQARDSMLVIAQTYAPPDEYIGVDVLLQPAEEVILRGYQVIDVLTGEGFNALLSFRKPFHVTEGKQTTITLTIDLSKSLQKGAFTYTFVPYYEITSIQYQ
jgi:hypothetical protein